MTASGLAGFLKWGENVLELDGGAGCTTSHMQHAAVLVNRALRIHIYTENGSLRAY